MFNITVLVIELGLFVCGSAATVRKAFEDLLARDMRFGNLLVMCQFGTLPADLTRRNMEVYLSLRPAPQGPELNQGRTTFAVPG